MLMMATTPTRVGRRIVWSSGVVSKQTRSIMMSSMARRAKASRAYCALLAIDIELVDHREAAGQARGDEDKRRRGHAVQHAVRLQAQIMRVSGHGGHQRPYPRPAGLEQSPSVPYARVGRLGPAGKALGGREAKVKLAKRPTGAHSPHVCALRVRSDLNYF